MMKISALNEAPRPENDDEDVQTITKEAQEQIALTEYNRALELMKSSNVQDALTIFKDLLDTELLDQVEKSEVPDGRSRPMLSLKYSCYKNIGAIQASLENFQEAIENYWEAANLDDTDVTLWYRIGCLAMTISNLELACSSFKQGLKCNPNHWPCLDNIISALYAVPDYMNCLLFISMALERDPSYVKGLAFRERIFKDVPYIEESYKIYNVDWALDPPVDVEFDRAIGQELLAEAKEIARKWADACKFEFAQKPLPVLSLNKPLVSSSWLKLGESIVNMHKWMTENSCNFVSRVILDFQKPVEEESRSLLMDEINEDDVDDVEMDMSEHESVKADNDIEQLDSDLKQDMEIEEMDVLENCDDQRVPVAEYETEIRTEIEDDVKSGSSDVQIIEDEDPFKIPITESLRLQKQVEDQEKQLGEEVFDFQESMIVGDDDEIDKSNEENLEKCNQGNNDQFNDKNSEKLNDKSNDKSFKGEEKSNEKTEGKEEGQKVKKRRRSSLCFLQQWAWSSNSMRRSARVRGSNRKEAEREDVQLEETLRRMFPTTLLPDGVKLTKDDPFKNIDDSMDTMDLYQLFANRENNCNLTEGSKSTDSSKPASPDTIEQPKYFGTEMEKIDVEDFINLHSGKSNLMIIIAKYTEFLSTKWNHEWPEDMGQVYLETYTFTREHVPHPSPFGDDEDHGILKYDAEMTLLFGELHTDRWMDNKPDVLPSSNLDKLGTGMPSEELGHIIFASVRDDLFNEENTIYLLRVLWLKANIFHCQGDTDIVIETLELLLTHMEEFQEHASLPSVRLPNCKYNSRINIPVVQKMLTAIRRGQKLGQVQRLYAEKKYAELAATLQDTFKFAKQRQKLVPHIKITIDRIDQLAMLLDSLWKLEQYEECYVWAEACLNESWQNYLNANEESEQKKWASSVLKCLAKLDACVSEVSTFIVRYLPESRLARLVQNLVQMVCHQLDVTETAVEMPLETVLPWIILHYVLQYEDDKGRAKSPSAKAKEQNSDSEDEDEDIPASIMILLTAHDFLGRHSWCCINEAKLLLFTMKLVIPRLRTPQFSSVRDKLEKHLEQIFYCLYGHPNKEKKSKPKYLEDHRVPQIELTWEGAQLLFDFYRPDNLPEYDSPRTASINADTHNLFKKVISLVPEEHDPGPKIDEVTAYIIGDRENMPTVQKPLPYQVSSVYFLLGDYLFKYNQYSNSTCYFLMDLCLHPEAFNSWATLAMVTSTEFGTSLTSCKPLPDIKKLLLDAKIAQCCYQRAVDLVPAQSVIWIEYGTFAYTVHSFCSRLLKQETDTLSMERFEALETRKEDTLGIAVNCFTAANRMFIDDNTNVHDERWLYHYMLAKIAEKKNEDPPVYLDHYAKASDWLHKNSAHYPRRILHKNPHYLSVEALEVHYRIHACILKYLEQHEGKCLKKSLGHVFMRHLLDCASSPFMQFESKLNRNKRTENDGYSEVMYQENITSEIPKSRTNQERRLNSVEEIPIPEKTESYKATKNESRKRHGEAHQEDSGKRIKLGSVSHLQLMQDVVGVIDDLITNVSNVITNDIVVQRDGSGDEVMVLSSDESEKAQKVTSKDEGRKKERSKNIGEERSSNSVEQKLNSGSSPEVKSDNVQDLMDALMKRAMEMSRETEPSPPDEEDTRKSDGKWLQNEDFQLAENRYFATKNDKDAKERTAEKKKTQINAVKDDVSLSRRGSQESTTTTQTTTTTTETNNSSSSSSDESSSSEDSSESDSSSDSDSDSADSDPDKKKPIVETSEKEEYLSDTEVAKMIGYCLAGLEQCVIRFPEHYKSIYRLCHYFFNNKGAKDNAKCRDLLLGTYRCQYYSGHTFQGLFADRKLNNFFNGVWRNPIEEIDRPGSFASHMSRCITLLMQILKETEDSRMLMELCIQLRKTPDADKKYLRDSEREQLSRQALTLCLQSLRTRIQNMGPPPNAADNIPIFRTDSRKQMLLDVYKIYREVQKTFQGKDSTIQAFATLLIDTYKTYTGVKNIEGNVLEIALKCCQQTLMASKIAASTSNPTTNAVSAPATSSSPVTTSQPQSMPTSPQTQQSRKPYKSSSSTGRPRGRPPNVNKYLQAMQQSGGLPGQFNPKGSFGNYLGVSGNRALINPYFMNPLIDPNMLSAAMLAAGLGGNMLDPLAAVNYLNQMGSYQDILRQYQNNLSSISNLAAGYGNIPTSLPNSNSVPTVSTASSNVGTIPTPGNLGNLGSMGNIGNLTVQQLLNLSNAAAPTSRPSPMYHQAGSKTTTTTSTTKEIPSVSITPVGSTLQQHKTKAPKHNDPLPAHISKSMSMSQTTTKPVAHSPTTQVSLLKPSVIQQTKTAPPKQMSAPQIRVSKSLTEPQPAHNSSVSHSSLNSVNPGGNSGSVPQAAHNTLQGANTLSIKQQSLPMSIPSSRGGTSLQHKLLSKKLAQQPQPPPPPKTQNNQPMKKQKPPKTSIPQLPNNLQSLLNTMSAAGPLSQTGFIPPELSGISVSPIGQSVPKPVSVSKHSGYRKPSSKTKSTPMELPATMQNPLTPGNSVETLSMLSQLQQHSHLEIIPQQKNHPKPSQVDFSKGMPLSLSVVPPQKQTETKRPSSSDCMSVFELPRTKSNNNPPKKPDKQHAKDSVEIITLDD